MAAFTQLSIVVANGDGTKSTVVISIPPGPANDPQNTSQSSATASAQQMPGVAGIVETIRKVGFWDAAGANFYPPASVLKITPQ